MHPSESTACNKQLIGQPAADVVQHRFSGWPGILRTCKLAMHPCGMHHGRKPWWISAEGCWPTMFALWALNWSICQCLASLCKPEEPVASLLLSESTQQKCSIPSVAHHQICRPSVLCFRMYGCGVPQCYSDSIGCTTGTSVPRGVNTLCEPLHLSDKPPDSLSRVTRQLSTRRQSFSSVWWSQSLLSHLRLATPGLVISQPRKANEILQWDDTERRKPHILVHCIAERCLHHSSNDSMAEIEHFGGLA